MKLAVSSLVWSPADDELARSVLTDAGVGAIELAPLKYWPVPSQADRDEVARYRAGWEASGIRIVALQGILFGQPALQLFGDAQQRDSFERHLVSVCDIAHALGAHVLVLGAPKNRLRGPLTFDQAVEQSVPVFRRIAAAAVERGCAFVMEANPPLYGGDFGCTLAEISCIIDAVDHPGLGVHLDTGAATIAHEDDAQIASAARRARHFHISEINLVPIGDGSVDHAHIGRLLRESPYDHWHSIEMAPVQSPALSSVLGRSIALARANYA